MPEALLKPDGGEQPPVGRRPSSVAPTSGPGTTQSELMRGVRQLATSTAALSTISVVVGLVLWQAVGAILVRNSLFLATPTQTASAIAQLSQSGQLQRHIAVSAEEFVIGFVVGSVAGIVIGLAMASSQRVDAILSPWVSGFYATPIVALAPLIILWFGIDIWSKVVVVISLVVFPVIINTDVGIRSTDPQLVEAIRAFGASRRQIFLKVSIPCAMPFILAGLRLGVGRGLIGVVVGELFGARAGLGFLIGDASQIFDMPRLFAGVVLLALAGIILTNGFQRLERYLLPWRAE